MKGFGLKSFTLFQGERLFTTANEARESLSMLVLRILGNPFKSKLFQNEGGHPLRGSPR